MHAKSCLCTVIRPEHFGHHDMLQDCIKLEGGVQSVSI